MAVNVLILCNKMPFPPNDGGSIATLNMVKGFAQLGDCVHVLTMQTYKHPFHIKDLPENIKNSVYWHQVYIDTRIKPHKALCNLFFSKIPYNAERFIHSKFAQQIQVLLETEKFDVIQLEGLYVTPYIQIIRHYSNAVIAYRAHNIEHEIWIRLSKNTTSFLKRWYFKILANRIKRMENVLMHKIDLLIPITERDATLFPLVNREKISICPGGMDDLLFQKTEIKNHQTLCFLGALDWIPNQEGLLWFIQKVWFPLKLKYPQWEFKIAGRNAPTHFVANLKKYPVEFIGEVANSFEFIDPNAIVVVPLLSGSGMRLKIVEAMARGKCIVTTSMGAEGISAENGISIFKADTPQLMISLLENLFQNYDLIQQCGKNAFTFAFENFRNSQLIADLKNFYLKNLK